RHRALRDEHRLAQARAGGDQGVRRAAPAPEPVRRARGESPLAGLDLLATAIVVLDSDGCATFLNPSAEQLFEVSRRIVVGQPFARLFLDGAPIEGLVAGALAGEDR